MLVSGLFHHNVQHSVPYTVKYITRYKFVNSLFMYLIIH